MSRAGLAALSVIWSVAATAAARPEAHSAAPSAAMTRPSGQALLAKAKAVAKKRCKRGHVRIQAAECPKGARCAISCVAIPKHGRTPWCPAGRVWKAEKCPAGAQCLLAGRCVAASSANAKAKVKAKAKAKGAKAKVVKAGQAKLRKLVRVLDAKSPAKCAVGRVLTRVACFRAPCPRLCLPARLDPSLKASPKVKPL